MTRPEAAKLSTRALPSMMKYTSWPVSLRSMIRSPAVHSRHAALLTTRRIASAGKPPNILTEASAFSLDKAGPPEAKG